MKKFMSIIMTIVMVFAMGTVVLANPTASKGNIPTIGTGSIDTGLGKAAGTVLQYVQWFGYAMAIGMLLYIGMKYMMASANEKADLKKGSINYVIGAILVAAASTIVGILSNIGSTIAK